MTQEEYVDWLEDNADPTLVERIKDWPIDTKLYMYLHHKQLDMMSEYKRALDRVIKILENNQKYLHSHDDDWNIK